MAGRQVPGAKVYLLRLGAIGFAAMVAAGPGPVRAQGDGLEQRCAASEGKAEDRIAACTALIESGRARGPALVTLRLHRAGALSAAREFARAAADANEALRLDPANATALERAFLASLLGGDFAAAVRFAERLVRTNASHRTAQLVLAVQAIKRQQYANARQHLSQAGNAPIVGLTATLLAAWALRGEGQTRAAIEAIDKLKGADWYEIFKDFHAGLIFDLDGQSRDAGIRFSRAHDRDSSALRVVEAYGRWTFRAGSQTQALTIFGDFDKRLPRHPLVLDAIENTKAGKRLPPLIGTVEEGAAEVLYGVGASLGRRGGADLAFAYLQLALVLAPRHPLTLMSLADLYENEKKPRLAIEAYLRVPADSLLKFNAELQRAANLNGDGRVDEATSLLERLLAERPQSADAGMAFGNVLRVHQQFAACAEAYGRGIAALGTPRRSDWVIFYFRGICHERNHQWAKAEPDLKKALELNPDQPQVMNYLGYSWVDRGIHLEEGMRLIRRAVEQRPDDGYIVDSLGWGLYQSGLYVEALTHIKRAAELLPKDPTISDHLGDNLWKLGRHGEAQAQWRYALALKPAPEDLKRIEKKLQSGIPDVAPAVTVSAPVEAAKTLPPDAGRRVALVIGNAAYRNVPVLLNPGHDAKAIADVLSRIGFQEVIFQTDTSRDALLEALRRFAAKAEKADWAVIYFAGHGIEMGGTNYLIPVDARLATDRDVELEAVPLDRVMTAAEGARKLRLVLLDACRNNPFIAKMQTTAAPGPVSRTATSGSTGKGRSINPGLAELSPEAGTLVVFAAKHGKEALDGDGENSPFVAAIVKRLPTPGVEVRRLFDVVRDDVLAATKRQQQPFSYGSLPGSVDFFFVAGK